MRNIVKSAQKFTECPSCQGVNIQPLGTDSQFCLDCNWDNLPDVTKGADPLISALRFGDAGARREAVQVLINIGDTDRDIASSDDIVPLLEALDDEDDDVRYFATVALSKIGETDALEKLRQVVQNDPSELVRIGAMIAIENLET